MILTGAGISTDSGIPDYRGAGLPAHKPTPYDAVADEVVREPISEALPRLLRELAEPTA